MCRRQKKIKSDSWKKDENQKFRGTDLVYTHTQDENSPMQKNMVNVLF